MEECKYRIEDFDNPWFDPVQIENQNPNRCYGGKTFKSEGMTLLLAAQNGMTAPQERMFVATKDGTLYYTFMEGNAYWNFETVPILKTTVDDLKKFIDRRVSLKFGICYYHRDKFKEFLNELSTQQGTKNEVPERSNGVVT